MEINKSQLFIRIIKVNNILNILTVSILYSIRNYKFLNFKPKPTSYQSIN